MIYKFKEFKDIVDYNIKNIDINYLNSIDFFKSMLFNLWFDS